MALRNTFFLFLSLSLMIACESKRMDEGNISSPKSIAQEDTVRGEVTTEESGDKLVLSDTTNFTELREYLIDLDDFYMKNRHLADSIRPTFWKLCPIYYDLLRTNRAKRGEQLREVFASLPKDDGMNYAFLEKIIAPADTSLFAYQQPMGAIFHGVTETPAIFETKVYRNNPAEKAFFEEIKDHEDTEVDREEYIESTTKFPIKSRQDSVYVYTKKGRYTASVDTFNYYDSSCGSYYFYEMGEVEKPDDELVLLSSPYPIELDYHWNEELDKIMKERFQEVCADCPTSDRFQKTFARLKGYENFYFTYTREPHKETDDTYVPQRSLIYYNGDLFYTIWTMDVDTFGCSCL